MLAGINTRIHAEHGRDIGDPEGKNTKHNVLRKLMSFCIHKYIAVSKELYHWLIDTVNIKSDKEGKPLRNAPILGAYGITVVDASIIDIFWGFGFVIVNAFYIYNLEEINPRNWLLLVLVSIWGLRLTIYLAIRNIGKGEDYRYQQFRKDYGEKRYWWFSYFQVFLLQGALILIVSLPLLAIHLSESSGELFWLDYIAILVWIVGFFHLIYFFLHPI